MQQENKQQSQPAPSSATVQEAVPVAAAQVMYKLVLTQHGGCHQVPCVLWFELADRRYVMALTGSQLHDPHFKSKTEYLVLDGEGNRWPAAVVQHIPFTFTTGSFARQVHTVAIFEIASSGRAGPLSDVAYSARGVHPGLTVDIHWWDNEDRMTKRRAAALILPATEHCARAIVPMEQLASMDKAGHRSRPDTDAYDDCLAGIVTDATGRLVGFATSPLTETRPSDHKWANHLGGAVVAIIPMKELEPLLEKCYDQLVTRVEPPKLAGPVYLN